jgi:hypothetical protein
MQTRFRVVATLEIRKKEAAIFSLIMLKVVKELKLMYPI